MAKENHPTNMLPEIYATTPEDALSQNFYNWELRGRGWQLWVQAPELEPPFRPFFHWIPSRFNTARDDSRVPSLFDKVGDWLGGKKSIPSVSAETVYEEIIEPSAEHFENNRDLIEIEVALPPTLRISKEVATQLLISLTYCSLPLSFEVIGTQEAIIVQLVCRDVDLYPLRQQFAAYFPEAVLTERRYCLSTLWLNSGDNGVLVDFGLSHEFFIPLKTFSGFETDPLISIAGALSDLRPGEIGVLQVLFQPARRPWAESIFRSVTDHQGKAFFESAPELVAHAKHKISQPLYAAVIRVAARSPEEDRAWKIVKAIGGGLQHFGSPVTNELIPLTNEGYSDSIHEEDLLGRQAHRCGMLINSDELVSLVHPPSASVRAKRLKRLSKKSKAAPELAMGHELVLGENECDGEIRTVTLSEEQRVRHTYLIGASGTGKSTFMLNMICQDIEAGNGLAVLDPHGDLINRILERIPEERYGDVVLFDPADEEYPIGFNILSAHSEIEKHLLSSDLVSVFKRLSTAWGDQMTSVLGNAILSFLESDRGGTLAELRRFLVEKEYRADYLRTVKDPENVYYWQLEFPLLTGKPQAPLLTRLDIFLRPRLIRYMVAQKENKLDFGDIMNGQKIFLAKLSQGAIGEENAYLLGTLLVSKFHQMTLARQDMEETDRRPFYLYIDEFHNFVTPSMASILAGARKYRLGLILAHQELRQLGLGTSEIASAVISNPYTRVCFRLGDQDAGKLADGFSSFEAKDLQNLGTGEAICRMERAEFDFNLQTSPLTVIEKDLAKERTQRIIQLSRQRYGTRRDLVEAELAKNAPDLWKGLEPAASKRDAKKKQPLSEPPKAEQPSKPEPAKSESAPSATVIQPEAAQPEPPAELAAEVVHEYTPLAPATPKSKPKPVPTEQAMLGRGGKEHRHLQLLIKQWARGMGWNPTIEKLVNGGAGSIDVALERDGRLIACEVCVTTPVDKEVVNIEKCLQAGSEIVVSVSNDEQHLAKIQAAAKKKLSAKDMAKVRFFDQKRLFMFIEEMNALAASHEKRSDGITVKVRFHAKDQDTKSAKKQDISASVAESIDALRMSKAKGKDKP